MPLDRRTLLTAGTLALAAPALLGGLPSRARAQASAPADVASAVQRFAALPATTGCLIEAAVPGAPWSAENEPTRRLFVGSAVKTFILAQYLKDVENRMLSEDEQRPIDDGVRSPDSPVFLNLTGTTQARSILEAMIAHSDNTATDAALAAVGADRVRTLIQGAGLTRTQIPDSTRRLFSWLAGAGEGVDLGWDGIQRAAAGWSPGKPRKALNAGQTMASTAADMVSWYRQALAGSFFNEPATLTEFKRIQAMADAIPQVVPADTVAYAKGGSVDWEDFHCFCLAGQMLPASVPVTFCFTINWTGSADGVADMFAAFRQTVGDTLSAAALAVS